MTHAEIILISKPLDQHNKYIIIVIFPKYPMLNAEISFIHNLLYNIFNIKLLFDIKIFYVGKSFVQKLFFL